MRKTIILITLLLILSLTGCTQQTKEITITSQGQSFSPTDITVNKGDIVRITLISATSNQDFYLPEFDIDKTIVENRPSVIEFTADKKGEFTFWYHNPSQDYPRPMRGTLTVE